MAKEYLVIFDRVDKWEVTDTMIIPDGYEVPSNHDGVMDMSDEDMKSIFLYVRDKLQTHRIFIPKEYDGRLIKEDLIEESYDVVEIERMRKIRDGKELLSTRVSIPEIFGFAEFIILNNFFIEKGYVITEENRTDKYLDIINTGDSILIEKLENYLEVRDSIMWGYSWYNVYKNFKNKIQNALTIEEMNTIWKDYVQTFE